MRRLDGVLLSWWFGHTLLLILSAFVVTVAAALDPSPEVVSLFGVDIPILCGFRRLTGMGCPGCGLTRSFAFMAHGDVVGAFGVNWLGPPMFVVVLAQLPWRSLKLWQGPPEA